MVTWIAGTDLGSHLQSRKETRKILVQYLPIKVKNFSTCKFKLMNAVSFEYKYTLNSNPFGLVCYDFNAITTLHMDKFQSQLTLTKYYH